MAEPETIPSPTEETRLLGNENDPVNVEEELGNNNPQIELGPVKKEVKTLFVLSLPVIGSYLISYINVMAPLLTLGHLGTQYLAAISLATMTANITGFSIGQGLGTALDTLCAQAFTGSDDKHALGKHLQRGVSLFGIYPPSSW